jgi:FG-GAP repeat
MTTPHSRRQPRGSIARQYVRLAGVVTAVLAVAAASGAQAAASSADTRAHDGPGRRPITSDFNGDGYADLAVGVPLENLAGPIVDGGAVSVLYGSASGVQADAPGDQFWTATKAGGVSANDDRFGSALAVGDFNADGFGDLAVGAPLADVGGAADAGSVTVLYGSSSGLQVTTPGAQTWTEESGGVPGNAEAGDRFGGALAVGDLDGDGHADLAIGVSGKDVGGVDGSGSVVVLLATGSGLQTSGPAAQAWTEPDVGVPATALDGFGSSVGAGDFDGDGHDDLAIGIPYRDQSATTPDSGSAAVLYGSAAGPQVTNPPAQVWTQNSPNVDESAQSGDRFAFSLASGDLNQDGFDELLVGVPYEGVWNGSKQVATAGGMTLLYGSASGLDTTLRVGEFWSQAHDGVIGLEEDHDHFGYSLATGDMNGDGFVDVVVGVPQEDGGPESIRQSGAANVLYSDATGLTAINDWHLDQDGPDVTDLAERYDFFATSVALADFNGDGYADLAAGVPNEALTKAYAGAVHVLYAGAGGLQAVSPDDVLWSQDSPGVLDTEEPSDVFGTAVAAAG